MTATDKPGEEIATTETVAQPGKARGSAQELSLSHVMNEIKNHISEVASEAIQAPASQDCMRLLLSLGDETDPLLSRVLDRSRRRDGLLPTRTSIESGPLSAPGSPVELFHDGAASDEDYTLALIACEAMRESGNPGERELAALSLAILEASSIVYRRRLLVSETMKEADARLAAAAAGLPSEWARLAYAAMRMPLRASA
jgi:hypothetical protein